MVIQDITERRQIEEVVRASLREKEVMLKEIHHRVRNNLQVVSSLLRLQSADLENEAVREVFANSQRRIASMALIHEALYNSSDLARIDFEPYVTALVANLVDSFGAATAHIDMQVRVQAAPLSLDRALPMGLIVSELVSNALRHAFAGRDGGRIAIELTDAVQGEGFTLSISDNGVGLPQGADTWESPGLGLRLVEALAGQLRARLHVDRARGTTFTLTRS
jgi:two-component sensor histidine kinase